MGTLPSMGRYGQGCALVAIAFLTAESRLQAYIDPGTTGAVSAGTHRRHRRRHRADPVLVAAHFLTRPPQPASR